MSKATDDAFAEAGEYETMPSWFGSKRSWESAETNRLNSAHWSKADDASINVWLQDQLETLRMRAIYESRNNGIMLGMQSTHADDIVGQDGPTLQVQSDDDRYNTALERTWQDWFAAPTTRPNVSGAALLKLWIRNLWKCGEFVGRMVTMPGADGPVALRLWPCHPRRLATPATMVGNDSIVMGIQFDEYSRPVRYWIDDQVGMGTNGAPQSSTPYPSDLVIHEFVLEEEDQVRGVPLSATGLQTAADLRDYDDQVQDAARQIADQSALLYTDHPDADFFNMPESAEIERRSIRMVPARLDVTTYRRATGCIQAWLSGSERSTGALNRLVDEVAKEGRFSVPALRRRPERVAYLWTWPQLDDVEPYKTAKANETDLTTKVKTLTEILASKKKTLSQHIEELRREREAFEEAGLPLPEWMNEANQVAEAAMLTEA